MNISSSKKITVISVLFFALSVLYIVKTVSIITILFQLDKAVGSFHAPKFYFLEFYSYFLIFPILFSIASVIFFYCGLKVKDRSPLGWLLGMLFCVAIPLPLWYIGKITMEPTTYITFGPYWKDYTIVTGVLLFIVLMLNHKVFDHEGKPIARQYKYLILIFFICIAAPTIALFFYVKYQIKARDYDYPKIQSSVNFYVYQPKSFPDGRVYETNYFIQKRGLTPKHKTVEFNANYSLSRIMETRKTGLIIVKQSKLDDKTDIRSFIKDIKKPEIKIKEINLPQNKEKSLYATIKTRKSIIIPTVKNTVIVIEGYYLTEADIIEFAKSFY